MMYLVDTVQTFHQRRQTVCFLTVLSQVINAVRVLVWRVIGMVVDNRYPLPIEWLIWDKRDEFALGGWSENRDVETKMNLS